MYNLIILNIILYHFYIHFNLLKLQLVYWCLLLFGIIVGDWEVDHENYAIFDENIKHRTVSNLYHINK